MNSDILRINCIYLFATLLDDKNLEINDFFKLLDEFIKKIGYDLISCFIYIA